MLFSPWIPINCNSANGCVINILKQNAKSRNIFGQAKIKWRFFFYI
jgi:hypothetical protein